ncbi:50S ribosomal protein L4 [Bartonella sp. TP]|uniref:50S ribosomal protein L4 n=1 Tax=Bartonella sp. TP TaxID=3057550 RepID=UPI0025AF98A0|nr:50S ribosomal protein L4 [Bartonella sp. TP]WJW79808.1 50S ribosomal protein L4 [Bartonella sp. TP]
MELSVKSLTNLDLGAIVVSDSIFALPPREDILQRVVRWQLLKRQQGTHDVQTRSDVSRTGAKMYKQKGTGRARHSSARVSQFRGGGKSHGPVTRSYAIDLPKKIRALGLKCALSSKTQTNDLLVVDKFDIDDVKTSSISKLLHSLDLLNVLFIADGDEAEIFSRGVRNIPNVDVLSVAGINVYDILRRDKLVLSKAAVESLEERFK